MTQTQSNKAASPSSQRILKALQEAVHEALEKKRKLGQYAVVWDGEKPVKLKPTSDL